MYKCVALVQMVGYGFLYTNVLGLNTALELHNIVSVHFIKQHNHYRVLVIGLYLFTKYLRLHKCPNIFYFHTTKKMFMITYCIILVLNHFEIKLRTVMYY